MLSRLEEKVDAMFFLLHFDALIMHVVFQNELFEKKKSLFVLGVLAQLDYCSPGVRRELFLAIFTLLEMFGKLDYETFLHRDTLVNFLRNSEFDLNSSTVRLSIEEYGVDQFKIF